MYSDPDIILLDDPLSALDAVVKKKVFKQVINGLLRNKTRILVTHAVEYIHLADRIVLMKDGMISAIGTPEELKDHSYIREIAEIQAKNRQEAEKRNESSRNIIEAALDNVVPDEQLLLQKIALEEARLKLEKNLDTETTKLLTITKEEVDD